MIPRKATSSMPTVTKQNKSNFINIWTAVARVHESWDFVAYDDDDDDLKKVISAMGF